MKLSISMSRKEVIFGWLLMVGQLLILPVVAVMLNDMLSAPLSDTQMNIALFALEFLFATIIFRKFLKASARSALRTPFRCLRFAALGLLLYYIGSFLVGLVIGSVDSDFSNINDSNISVLAQDNYTLIFLCTVLLVPVTEELLYRGLIFRGLQKKNRLVAYLLSAVVFSLIHVVGYIGLTSTTTLLLCLLQYIPAGLSLAWTYEKADTIWAPILMHMTVNQISISLMR